MYRLLNNLSVVEAASFIAAPSCGLHLAQLGAEVIRIDTIGGGPDFNRWPRAQGGASFFWEGLNKGKKSIALDLRHPEGRRIATELITAPGETGGIFLTNFPAEGFLAHKNLAARRADLITLRIMGRASGVQAVDYTVNSAVGYPYMTGPAQSGDEPINHVLPAWDLLTGAYGAFALLAAHRARCNGGGGQEVRLPLFDVAAATIGHLGQIAEVIETGHSRPRYGNALFGAFGRDFTAADGRRIMLVAITPRQWSSLVEALGIGSAVSKLEGELSISFAQDEGLRFIHRDLLFPIVEAAVARQTSVELAGRLDAGQVCWSHYRTLDEAMSDDPDLSAANPILSEIAQPSGLTYLTPGSAASFGGADRLTAVRAPRLGEHTDEILSTTLGLTDHEIARLHDRGIVDSAPPS